MNPQQLTKTFDAAVQAARAGDLASAERICAQVLAQDAKHAGACDLMGVIKLLTGRPAEGLEFAKRASTIEPNRADFWNNLGALYRATNQLEPAAEAFGRSAQVDPRHANALCNQGHALLMLQRREQARNVFERALQVDRNAVAAHAGLGKVRFFADDFAGAEAAFSRAVELAPRDPENWYNLGITQEKLDRASQAITCFARAAELNPNYFEALISLGKNLTFLGRGKDAVEPLRRAVELRPDDVDARRALGLALGNSKQNAAAAAEFYAAMQLEPNDPDTIYNYANAAWECNRYHIAVENHARVLELVPNHARAMLGLASAYDVMGKSEPAMKYRRMALELEPDEPALSSSLLFSLHSDPNIDAKTLVAEHRRWEQLLALPLRERRRPHQNDRDPKRRLRVGYVSADFFTHPVAHFIEPVLEHHDKSQVELYCYSDTKDNDAITARIRRHADVWHETLGMSHEQLADRVRADKVDVLIDLAVHTAATRLLVFAQRPAPVQLSYLGYCGTTGLSDAIDGRITDAVVDPPGVAEAWNTEPLIRLPRTWCCYRPIDDSPEVAPLPAEANGFVTFGSFNRLSKATPAMRQTWAQLLLDVPGSHLLIQASPFAEEQTREEMLEFFEQQEIARDRLELIRGQPIREYMKTIGRCDIALDTFPFAGHTTTCNAMWMGVPTVTLAGEIPVSRAGASLMTSIGLTELITRSLEEYRQTAASLARDVQRLGEMRRTMRERMQKSDLMDAVGMTRALEKVYREKWAAWCA